MKHYSLIFIFGKKEYQNDQVLLVSKKQGLNKNKWNGLGKLIEGNPGTQVLKSLVELQIDASCTISKAAVLAYPDAQVYVYGVFLNYDLSNIINGLDTLNKYAILHPLNVARKSFKGNAEYMEDLAYLLPMVMSKSIEATITQK